MRLALIVAVVALVAGSVLAQDAAQKESAVQKTGAVQKADVPEVAPVPEATQKDGAVQKGAVDVVVVGPLQALCLRKARIQATRGRVCHPGGGFGGARCEGAGSGSTPAAALAACCYSGTRRVAAQAVVLGRNGRWYATRLFW